MATLPISVRLLPLLVLLNLCFCFADLSPRQPCGQGYHLCSPEGASVRDVPEIGPGLTRLYLNLVETVNPQPAPAHLFERSEMFDGISFTGALEPASPVCFSSGKPDKSLTAECTHSGYGCLDLVGGSFLDTTYDAGDKVPKCDKNCQCPQPLPRRSSGSVHVEGPCGKIVDTHQERAMPGNLCCEQTTECLLVLSYDIPVCWDRFTTNYYLTDGSYGSIVSGNYTTPNGDEANLITGNYRMANGQSGNIYQADKLDEPNTSSLPIPTPWTSSGVGSAIPASEVGAQASSNSSGTLFLPTLATTSGTSTSISVPAHTTLSASASTATSSTSSITSLHRSTAPASLDSTTASVTAMGQPEITPPRTDSATTCASRGSWLITVSCAVVTCFMMF